MTGKVGAPARRWTSEAGSGTVLAIGVLACLIALTAVMISVCLALAVRQRVESAADAAALAAADTASGVIAGYPCPAARRAAGLNGSRLDTCTVDGLIATVAVHEIYLGFTISARARAGPPPAAGVGMTHR